MTDNSHSNPQQPWGQPHQPPQRLPGQAGPPPAYGPPGQQQPGYAAPPQQAPYAPQQAPYPPQQPYGGPPPRATTSPASRIIGWLLVLVGLIAIGATFAPWAKAEIHGSLQGTPIAVNASLNAYDHASCSASTGMDAACDSADDSAGSASASGGDENRSMWEGWAIAPLGVLVLLFGVARGLGRRALNLPAAVVGIIAGGAVVGIVISRWTWISDRSSEYQDHLAANPYLSSLKGSFGAGWGMWLALAAGVLMLLIGIGGLIKRQ